METLPLAGAEALHSSNKGEGREGGPRERCEFCYDGQQRKILYELLLFCQCEMRLDHLVECRCRRPVVGRMCWDFEKREVNSDSQKRKRKKN